MWQLDSIGADFFDRIKGGLAYLRVFTVHSIIQGANDAFIGHALKIRQGGEAFLGVAVSEGIEQDIRCRTATRYAHFLFSGELNQPRRFGWGCQRPWDARVKVLHLL